MIPRALFICYSTPNYSEMTSVCLGSLRDINATFNHLLDENNTPKKGEETGFRTDIWYQSVRNKLNHLVRVLQEHVDKTNVDYFIFTDCDIVYMSQNIHEWCNLAEYIDCANHDIYFMRESETEMVNSGFFVIKKEKIKDSIEFFTKVISTIEKTPKHNMPVGDQSIINDMKHQINYGFVPNDYVIFGRNIYNKNKSLFHHAVCCRNVQQKLEQIRNIQSRFKNG